MNKFEQVKAGDKIRVTRWENADVDFTSEVKSANSLVIHIEPGHLGDDSGMIVFGTTEGWKDFEIIEDEEKDLPDTSENQESEVDDHGFEVGDMVHYDDPTVSNPCVILEIDHPKVDNIPVRIKDTSHDTHWVGFEFIRKVEPRDEEAKPANINLTVGGEDKHFSIYRPDGEPVIPYGYSATAEPVDNVNHPPHYNKYPVEVLDGIEGMCTPDEFRGYSKGNIIKYVTRYQEKHGIEDLKKANVYLNRLISFEEKMSSDDR